MRNAHKLPKGLPPVRRIALWSLFICLAFAFRAEAGKTADYKELFLKAESSGSVRIIVELDVPFVPEGMLPAGGATDQRAGIERVQNRLIEALREYGAKGVKKFRFIPYIAMEVDSRALSQLISYPTVISIQEDVPLPPALGASIPLISADNAWASGYTGSGWAVAILDTGVDKTHSFLSGKIISEACFSTTSPSDFSTSLCPNGKESQLGNGAGVNCPESVFACEHGTHVAGIAAGRSSTINGVAKDADIISVQIYSRFDSESYCGFASVPCVLAWTSDQIFGLEYIYSLHATYHIAAANMSLGGGKYLTYCDGPAAPEKAAIDNLRSVGIATVIAAGNGGYCDGVSSPSCISTAVPVMASTKNDDRASFSNYSPLIPALFAPGAAIFSSVPNGWASLSGTSMAAPHVTGAWAILRQRAPSASVSAIFDALRNTGDAISNGCDSAVNPRIDVMSAVNSLGGRKRNLLMNPGFESGKSKWIEYSSGGDDVIYLKNSSARTGSWLAWLGGYKNAVDYCFQDVTIPSNTTNVYLQFWQDIETEESSGVHDSMSVELRSPGDNALLETLDVFSNLDETSGWRQSDSYDLTAFKGQTVRLRFYATTDSSMDTDFFIDDVELVTVNPSFADVPLNHWASDYIYSIYSSGITNGCSQNPLNYCPAAQVSRQEMAAFIIRAHEGEPADNYCESGSPFTDIRVEDQFCKYIKRLFELGITTGCTASEYCPSEVVTRGAMAAFIIRARFGETFSYTLTPYFADVTSENAFFKYIQKMKDDGITRGCTSAEYCPDKSVTRAEMAAFLGRSFLGMP